MTRRVAGSRAAVAAGAVAFTLAVYGILAARWKSAQRALIKKSTDSDIRAPDSAVPSSEPKSVDARISPDSLDKDQLDQLHAATLKASDSCFELKKLCATVLVPTGTLVAIFTDKRMNFAVFGAGFFVIVAFWLADSVGYFYQRKLRNAMVKIWERRAKRCSSEYENIPEVVIVGPFRAAFNSSMIYYLILLLVLLAGLALFETGIITSIAAGSR